MCDIDTTDCYHYIFITEEPYRHCLQQTPFCEHARFSLEYQPLTPRKISLTLKASVISFGMFFSNITPLGLLDSTRQQPAVKKFSLPLDVRNRYDPLQLTD